MPSDDARFLTALGPTPKIDSVFHQRTGNAQAFV